MSKKTKKEYDDPLSIWQEMKAVDLKDYDYYDRLNEDQKKQFSTYLLMRWASTVEGTGDIPKYYTVATNEFVNANFFSLSRHKKLQWLIICAISPNIGKQRHYWLGANKGKGSSALKNILLELLPNTKESDIDLMLKLNAKEELKEWLRQCGKDEKTLKAL
jgi:hypothetical protein